MEAQAILGKCYFKGKNVSQDINKAIYYLTPVANQNDSEAQIILFMIYYSEKNIDKANFYLSILNEKKNQIYVLN